MLGVQKRPKCLPLVSCFYSCSCSMWLVAITFFFRTIFPRLAEFCCILDSKIQALDQLRQEALLPSQLETQSPCFQDTDYFFFGLTSQDPTGPCQLHTHWEIGKRFRRGIIANPSRDMQLSYHNFFPYRIFLFRLSFAPGIVHHYIPSISFRRIILRTWMCAFLLD